MNKSFEFIGSCVSIRDVTVLDNMMDNAIEITKATFFRRCIMYYETKKQLNKEKWGVFFYKSKFNGVPCYFFQHSAIEYIYTLEGCYNIDLEGS